MKKLFLIISLLIALSLLSACATPVTATPTAFPEATSTSIPTSIPPTATIEPSPTVDPNMPEGATGKDANGNYTKAENGVNVVWNAELNTYERHLNADDAGVPLAALSTALKANGLTDDFYLIVNISDTIPGFDRAGLISFHPGVGDQQIPISFAMQFPFDLARKLLKAIAIIAILKMEVQAYRLLHQRINGIGN